MKTFAFIALLFSLTASVFAANVSGKVDAKSSNGTVTILFYPNSNAGLVTVNCREEKGPAEDCTTRRQEADTTVTNGQYQVEVPEGRYYVLICDESRCARMGEG
jgi:hypothetical protein